MHDIIKQELAKNKIYLFAFIFIYLLNVILILIDPLVFGKILDLILANSGEIVDETKKNIIILILVLLSIYLTNFIYRRIVFSTGRKIKQGVFVEILKKIETADIKFFDKTDKGTFISYIINDINELWGIFSHGFIEITRIIAFTIIGFIISIIYVNGFIGILVFGIFPLFIYFIMKLNIKAQKLLNEIKNAEALLSKKINDDFCGFTVIKSYVKEEETIGEFKIISKLIEEKNIQYQKIMAKVNGIVTFYTGFSFAISLICGVYLITQNQITVGSFIAFNSIIQKIMADYIYAGFLVSKYNQIKIINQRINILYNIETNQDGNMDMTNNPNIYIKNLSFKYPGEDNYILENVNMEIPKGSFIGILGKTGSGKTTFANILTKFYTNKNDSVFFDNIDINDINRKSFYSKVSYVMQEDYIYNNTISHNIKLYKTYTQNNMDLALEKAEFLSTVKSFKETYETVIGESGIKLSGGQKQRLILARNFITNPSILIIDNAFTGLDIKTRKKVIKTITRKNKNTTLILISSMIEDLEDANKIYVLKNKRLLELEISEVAND